MQSISLGQLQFQKKSKRKAGDGNSSGTFKFFTSSQQQSKWLEEADFMGPALIFGTGGSASIHYCNESFSSSTDCFVLKSDRDDIDMKYIYYFLRTNISILDNGFKGAGLKHISKEYLSEINIPLPTLEEQKSIIAKLDKLIELIELKKEAIGKTEELTKSVFLEMFGDPSINPKSMPVKALGSVCRSIKDGPHKSLNYITQGIPFVSVNNIIKGFWDFSQVKYISKEDYDFYSRRSKPEFGDILYTKGGTTGYAKLIDLKIDFLNWVHLALLKIDKSIINGKFLEYMLNSDYCYIQSQRYTRGIANRDLVLGEMAKIKILLPPLSSQELFDSIATKNEEIIKTHRDLLTKLQELYNATTQDIFN